MGDALVVATVPEEAFMREGHLNAFHQLPIGRTEIWEPPEEPTKRYGYGWYKNRDARREHTAAVRASLERFLNEHLRKLNHMLRTGWWVLGKVRVRVVECKPVPEREMRAFAKAIRGVKSPVASQKRREGPHVVVSPPGKARRGRPTT